MIFIITLIVIILILYLYKKLSTESFQDSILDTATDTATDTTTNTELFGILYLIFNYYMYRVKVNNKPCVICKDNVFGLSTSE